MVQEDTAVVSLEPAELQLALTALKLLLSTLGREEADELKQVQALIAKFEAAH